MNNLDNAMYIPLDSTHPVGTPKWYETNFAGKVAQPNKAQIQDCEKIQTEGIRFAKFLVAKVPGGPGLTQALGYLRGAIVAAKSGVTTGLSFGTPSNA